MAVPETITINGTDIQRPPEFAPQREDAYAGEYATCTGKLIADRIGWRFADMTLSWPALPQSAVDVLAAMSGEATLVFDDLDGTTRTETVIRTSAVGLRHRHTIRGSTYWKNVEVEVRFINVHSD